MAIQTHQTQPTRPAFIEGGPKGLFIDGRTTPAASGKTFRTLNPSTGALLAEVADGDARDIDLAVPPRAARSRGRGAASSRSIGSR